MDVIGGHLVVSATDVVAFLACPQVSFLDREAAYGTVERPQRDDPMLELLRGRGLDHEHRYLAQLEGEGLAVAVVDEPVAGAQADHPPESRRAALVQRRLTTRNAVAAGAPIVYQATFFDDSSDVWWRGHADFLRRVPVPSALGDWSYEPEDTKLSRHVSAGAVLQLCVYADMLAGLQGGDVGSVHVVLGDDERATVRLVEVAAYFRAVRERFEATLSTTTESYPLPTSHCGVCRWTARCRNRWEDDDHLTRVAFLTVEQSRRLEAVGIPTLTALAESPDETRVAGISQPTLVRLREQARLQRAAIPGKPPPYEVLSNIEDGRGLAALPAPDPGDVFYDIEGHPYAAPGGLEYLHGIGCEIDGEYQFQPWWALDEAQEKAVFERLVDFIVARRAEHPSMHVYHYAPYETTAIGRLMGKYGTREDAVDDLLRNEVFVDLYRVVRQGVRVGTRSYSIKRLEPLYMPARNDDIGDGGSSIVEFERWLQTSEQEILDAICAYNADDVKSNYLLRGWLEARRADLIAAGVDVPRPTVKEQPEDRIDPELAALIERLNEGRHVEAGLATDPMPGSSPEPLDEHQSRWLMADLLQWHRREKKPEWWQYFARILEYDADDFVSDTESLGRLALVGEVGTEKRSTVWRYRYAPGQEHKFAVGDRPLNPAAEADAYHGRPAAGTPGIIISIDDAEGTIDLKRATARAADHPEALIPGKPINTTVLEQSLRRVAEAILAHGVDGPGPYAAARALLGRRPPRVAGIASGAPLRDPGLPLATNAQQLVASLEQSILPIQGPPGTGKTYTAARVIVERASKSRRVAVTALSHAAIKNLIEATIAAAVEAGESLAIVQKVSDDGQGVDHPWVKVCTEPSDAEKAASSADVVAGTAWFLAREHMAGWADSLVVDEAGQLSLANVLAVAPCASKVVLVGDPQQLAQPSKGTHPDRADASALEHLLDGRATVPLDRGLLLDETRRLHPYICEFVSEQLYDGRLGAYPDCATQRIGEGPLVSGAGLRIHPVEHAGNRTSSPEEGDAVAALVDALVGRVWTDQEGKEDKLRLDDVLVVTPYNAQVHLLGQYLPEGARVGTVDKFQGQEAPVVIVSMVASSAEDVPRGMEFLYSRNRLNVAVSRAQALCVLVSSPALRTVQCRTVEQMRLANMLCRYFELAHGS